MSSVSCFTKPSTSTIKHCFEKLRVRCGYRFDHQRKGLSRGIALVKPARHEPRARLVITPVKGGIDTILHIKEDIHGILEVPDSGILIQGNVGPTAVVSSDGDIVVLGSLAGSAHAGKNGNRGARIHALSLQSTKLQIADVKAADGFQAHGQQEVYIHPKTGRLSTRAIGSTPQAATLTETCKRNPSATAAAVTGAYAMVAGVALTLAPLTVFGLLFDASQVTVGWIRVGGILFTLIGMQYLGTALIDGWGCDGGAASFYAASVWSRLYLVAAFLVVVARKEVAWGVGLLALINAMGALAMLRTLTKQEGAKA